MADLAYVALGSNLGDRAAHLDRARAGLSLLPRTRLVALSSIEETAPLAGMSQPPYLNQMAALRTGLEPLVLLRALLAIERTLGRVRGTRWGPRTIDLDLVRYGEHALQSPTLRLPHPGLATREFWQRELAEIRSVLGSAA